MVLLVSSVLQCDVQALVVVARNNLDIGATELGGYLVVTSCNYASRGTLDPVGRDWRVVGGLFGNVGYSNGVSFVRF